MATLNINLPDDLYKKRKAPAKRERRSVAREVIGPLSTALDSPGALSITGLQGLGAALWRDADAAAHVEAGRASWD